MSSMAIPDQFSVPQDQQLGRNPMLPVHPVTAAMDSQYSADEAVLRANISKQYADILQQLGYTDEQGNFIPGSVATNAARQQTDLQRSSDIAGEGVTQDSQRAGTLFSGYRGTQQARAQYPFQQSMLDLGINVPLTLATLHEQAAGLTDQYTLQNNQLLAAAAARAGSGIISSAGAGVGGGTPPVGGGTPPPGTIASGAPAPTLNAAGFAPNTSYADLGTKPSAIVGPGPLGVGAIGGNIEPPKPGTVTYGGDIHPADIAIAALKAIKPSTAMATSAATKQLGY